MPTLSTWTEADQITLRNLVRKHGFAHVVLGLRDVAYERRKLAAGKPEIGGGDKPIGWSGVIGLLTGIYDHIEEGRSLP